MKAETSNLNMKKVWKISNFYINASAFFSIITFIGFILSLVDFNQSLWFISIPYLLISGILLLLFIFSNYSEIIIYKDKFEKKNYFNSKEVAWNSIEHIFEEFSYNYPQKKIGHIKIYSKGNNITTINSYFDSFDNLQKIIEEKTLICIENNLKKKLNDNKNVTFFYSSYYKKTYVIFTSIILILIGLQAILIPMNLITLALAIFVANPFLKLILLFSTIEINSSEIITNCMANKKHYKISDIKKISIKSSKNYKNLARIIFNDNKIIKVDSKISNYLVLLRHLAMSANLTIENK